MALKAEILSSDPNLFHEVDVLDSTSSLDWSNGESLSVGKACNASCCIFQWTLHDAKRVEIVGKYFSQVPIMNLHLRVSSDQERELTAHIVNRLRHIGFTNLLERLRRAPCPKFDSWVPATTHDYRSVILDEAVDIFHWLGMCPNCEDLVGWQIPLLDVVISASNHEGWLVSAPTESKNWSPCCIL